MKSSRRTEGSLKSSSQQLTNHSLSTELTTAWKSLSQSKAALRHIENRLEATPGSGVLLESVMDPPKKKSVRHRGGQQADDGRGSSKRRGRSQQSPDKSSSRSPLRNTTQDSNVLRNNSVEFREPLTSFREATPPPHPSSQLEAYSLQSVPGSSHPSSPPSSDPLLSQLVYQRDTRDEQADRDLDSTRSSALESTEVRYLNDQPAPFMPRTIGNRSRLTGVGTTEGDRTPETQPGMDSQGSNPCGAPAPGSNHRGDSTPSSSPGSASQRLENLRRHQPDDKLEKLKERIRRQRQHLEEAAEREKLLGYLEQPIMAAVESSNTGTSNMPTAKIRKVAAAPPAPVYKGFNSTETKIRTPDGKVWNEEEFHNLSREIYRDLSRQFAETTRSRNQQMRDQRADRSKERRPPKPVRKVHRAAPSSDLNAKPVISPASWREGQKLVKMVLGPVAKPLREDRPQPADGLNRAASRHRSSSDPRSEEKSRSCPSSRERPHNGIQGQPKKRSTPSPADRDRATEVAGAELLSADIQGILDDLQLECREAEREERARQRSRGGRGSGRGRGGSVPQTRTPVSAWATAVSGTHSRGCRSASPCAHRPHTSHSADAAHKKRHYDADAVRQYILKQQEERKRRQAEEKRALREEAERRNQRLQELYRKQREAAKTVGLSSEVPVASVQQRLQETYNKLMEDVQLGEEATQTLPAAPASQTRPMYQPSGESDKENKRLEAPQSPSSSDRSSNDQPAPPLFRTDLDVGVGSLLQPDYLNPNTGPGSSRLHIPFGDPLLSQLLRLESAVAASDRQPTQRPATAPVNRPRSKLSRIEALKATAASLSHRIESEARKLAGEGINYGAATSMEGDTVLALRPSAAYGDDRRWAETTATENKDVGLRFQRISASTGHSSYDGGVFPGAGNLHTFGGQKQTMGTRTNLTKAHAASADFTGPSLNSYAHDRRKLVNGFEEVERKDKTAQRRGYGLMEDKNGTDLHDSSAGSISEGPLLSEGSFSEDETSPPRPSNKATDRAAAADYCAAQRKDFQRISEFQREAARCLALSSPFAHHEGSKAAWEELNKGSPLSVINIYTKNLQSHAHVMGRNSERTSPSAQPLQLGNGSVDAAAYEDDFVSSSHSSGHSGQLKRGSNSHSVNPHFEELMRRSPYEKNTGGISSNHSSFHSSNHSPHLSSVSSPVSKHSAKKRGTASDQSDATLVGEQRSSCSPPSDAVSSDSRKRGSDKSSAHSQARSVHHNDSSGETFQPSLEVDSKKFSAASSSPDSSPHSGANSPSEAVRSGSLGANKSNTGTKAHSSRLETRTTGQLQYSPAVLQQRMAAELHYLESIEESVRHLGDMERLMGVSMAQQESVSLAQMLKAKQQSHEHDLYELKIKAEREALEAQLQLEENRQRAARAHIELQDSLAGAQKDTLEGLQEAATKMMSQQAEAARYTAETARHIKEMTEMARSQIAGALVVPSVVTSSSKKEQQSSSQQRQDESDSFQSQVSSRKSGPEESPSPLNSLSHSDSLSFKRPHLSGADSSCHQSPSHGSSDHTDRMTKEAGEGKQRKRAAGEREAASSSIEEEVLTAANDSLGSESIHSVNDKGDSTSIATEYSLKFDESMTEDEIEQRSFRSLLPSEAHRRGTKEKKSRHHEESEDDGANHSKTLISGAHNILKDANMAFSGGQDSFSQFTMDMVRQYMKDEEVRLQHQSSLLHLRQKALKEKTKTELAWLEHQKRRLRDKGEDDKMPPIRKKQRGLLLKLQQEQAEIKRLQEANKAARKERQLLLKQQEEIERMRNSTLRLKERLKCAGGETPPETPVSETPQSEAASSVNIRQDGRSPSPPLSVSGSETSSIMQKLKKMRSHTDEKHCSPVHCFFSVFTAHHWASLSVCLPKLHPKFQLFIYNQLVRFLTKREQQLMQRRHHAEELLQWKQRLDQEEAEVRRMEKEAMAVWDRNALKSKEDEMLDISPGQHQSSELRTDSEKDNVSEGDVSSLTPESSVHTEGPGTEQPGRSPSSVQPVSLSETPLASIQSSHANYTQDFTSASHSPHRKPAQSPFKGSHSPASSPSDGSSKTRMQPRSSSRTPHQACTQPSDPPMAPQTDLISDQSDIESRIKALKEELRKRKSMANQLKKEQKKRNKERLKAKEASLLKQLESYDDFIEKTKAELNKEPDSTADSNSQIKDSASVAEQSSIKAAAHSSETSEMSRSERRRIDAALENNFVPQPDDSRSTSVPEELSDEDPPTVTPTPVHGSPESPALQSRSRLSTEGLITPSSKEAQASLNESVSTQFELPQQEKQDSLDSQRKLSKAKSSSVSEERLYSPSVSVERDHRTKSWEMPEAEQATQSNIIASNKSPSATADLETPAHLSSTSSNHSPDSVEFTSKKEAPIKDVDASSPIVDGYHDDFESSVDSSPRGALQRSEPASRISENETLRKDSPSRATQHNSHSEEVEEELDGYVSHQSGTSVASNQSGRLLDLNTCKKDDKDNVNSGLSPAASPLLRDEMPSFHIDDRVLVSGVQPGTLRFKGPTSFAHGFWAGVELDKSEGSNNGTYEGVVYFKCNESHGIFAPPDKITHLPDKFEIYTDTTEDEDSFFDDLPDKSADERKTSWDKTQNLKNKKEQTNLKVSASDEKKVTDELAHKVKSNLNSQNNKESEQLIPNGNTGYIMLDLEDAPTTLLISDMDKMGLTNHSQKEITPSFEREDGPSPCRFTPADLSPDVRQDKDEEKDEDKIDVCADQLVSSFVKDAVEQFALIKKAKEKKIQAANQLNGDLFGQHAEEEEEEWLPSVEQKDGLPFFLSAEKEDMSSPELCNQLESPVLGASGQEELAKRLAELELSRELLDELGDDQDWFDEDYGLSSRREQQRLKQKQREEEEEERLGRSGASAGGALVGLVSAPSGEQQVKTPPRPELPLQLPPKLPEQPAMVVPHSATEVEKMVHAAIQEIWETCGLGKEGALTLAQLPNPKPSQEYLGKEADSQDQEALSIRSYRKAVYDLTWEMLQEIYAEDSNTDQPQWVKPRRIKSSFFHRVRTAGEIAKVQEFITAEVLKLYSLTKDQCQKTDWQKMLKFGRKKRDRVDHILVQELHEEEAQWVNYDEDELFVKMQLADSIFDALLKDTANVLTQICDKRANIDTLS